MTITQLQYVLAVAEHKNFTLAAEKCFVTQPTLSMQIQKIEEELNVLIFDRSKKPIQLTDIGQKIVNQAKNIVIEADRIKDIVEHQKGFIGGEFRLGIIPTIMPTLLPMFLNNFIKKYPKIKLVIEELNTEDIILRLKNGHLDAAIAATPLEDEKIKEIVLYYEPFVAYIPESYAISQKNEIEVSDLNIDDILLLQDGHCFRDGILNLCKSQSVSTKNSFQLESGSFETLIKLADEG
ncbi:MAG: LysR family transcriptional regulator, partial [Flavobacterium sp.]|nr:LysR family transcriptional regulator [Flavobacterium sp.]